MIVRGWIILGDDNNGGGSNYVRFLDNLFEICSRARLEKDVGSWYDCLSVLTMNLSTEMIEAKLKEFKGFKKSYLSEINNCNKENESQGFNTIPIELEEKLSDWEIELRSIRKSAGLQQNINIKKKKFT